jgi:hypothetical protein
MKSIRKVYVSCPMTVSQSVLDKTLKHLSNLGVAARAWERGTPYKEENSIKYCDAFIVILPNNAFEYCLTILSSGTRKEILAADAIGKDIYICYTPTASSKPQFYISDLFEATRGTVHIKGIQGTHRNFLDLIEPDLMKKEEKEPVTAYYVEGKFQSVEKPKKDLRLLLTI